MAQPHHTRRLAQTEEALTVLFCLVDDIYAWLNPKSKRYASFSSASRIRRSSPSLSFSSCGAPRAKDLSCATRRGSSHTSSQEWSVFLPRHSIAAFTSSGATWSP